MFGLRTRQYVNPKIQTALAHRFTDAELAQLERFSTVMNIAAGAALTTEGRTGREVILIVEGSAVVSRGGDIIAEVGPGDIVGERSVVTGEARNATVMTTTKVTALVFSDWEFRTLLAENGKLAADVDQMVAERN